MKGENESVLPTSVGRGVAGHPLAVTTSATSGASCPPPAGRRGRRTRASCRFQPHGPCPLPSFESFAQTPSVDPAFSPAHLRKILKDPGSKSWAVMIHPWAWPLYTQRWIWPQTHFTDEDTGNPGGAPSPGSTTHLGRKRARVEPCCKVPNKTVLASRWAAQLLTSRGVPHFLCPFLQ